MPPRQQSVDDYSFKGFSVNDNFSNISFLRLDVVKLKTGLARSTVYKLMSLGDFPLPVKLTRKSIAWASNEIDFWISSRLNSRLEP
jgi:prophage regulatory protein